MFMSRRPWLELVHNLWYAIVGIEFYLIGDDHVDLSELVGEPCLPIK